MRYGYFSVFWVVLAENVSCETVSEVFLPKTVFHVKQ